MRDDKLRPEPHTKEGFEAQPYISIPPDKARREAQHVENLVRKLITDELAKERSSAGKLKALHEEEPQHPLVLAAQAWRAAILRRDEQQAIAAEKTLVERMQMYLRRPRFTVPFNKLLMKEPLAEANLEPLQQLADATSDF